MKKIFTLAMGAMLFCSTAAYAGTPSVADGEEYTLSVNWQNTTKAGNTAVGALSEEAMYVASLDRAVIHKYSADGIVDYATGMPGTIYGITIDEAGNLIWVRGGGSSLAPGSVYVLPAGKTLASDVKTIPLTQPSDIANGRVDQLGRVLGDVLSEEGGWISMASQENTKIVTYHIKNGAFAAAHVSATLPAALSSFSISVPYYATAAEMAASPATSSYVFTASSPSFYRPNDDLDGWTAVTRKAPSVTRYGLDWFELGGEKFYVYGNGFDKASGHNETNDIIVVRASDNKIVAQYVDEQEATTGSASVNCFKKDDYSVLINCYSSKTGAVQLTFSIPRPVDPETLGKVYVVGDFSEWQVPTEANASLFEDFTLTETGEGTNVYTGTVTAKKETNTTGEYNFRFFKGLSTADDWETNSFGSSTDAVNLPCLQTSNSYTGSIVAGVGNYQLVNWKGGTIEMTVDLNENTVSFEAVREGTTIYLRGDFNSWADTHPMESDYVPDEKGFITYTITTASVAPNFKFGAGTQDDAWSLINLGGKGGDSKLMEQGKEYEVWSGSSENFLFDVNANEVTITLRYLPNSGPSYVSATWKYSAEAGGTANPFAYGLTATYVGTEVTFNYSLNADATDVNINIKNAENGEVLRTINCGAKTAGTYSETCNDLADGAYTWDVVVEGETKTSIKYFMDETFWHPVGLAVDNSTESASYGTLFVASGYSPTSDNSAYVDGEANTSGIFIYTPTGEPVLSASGSNRFYGAGLTFDKNQTYFKRGEDGFPLTTTGTTNVGDFVRVGVSDDGRIFVARGCDSGDYLLYANSLAELQQTGEFTSLLTGNTMTESLVYNDEAGNFLAGPVQAMAVTGSGEDTKVLALVRSTIPAYTYISECYALEYAIGTATTLPTPAVYTPLHQKYTTAYGKNQSIEYDNLGGVWYCQYRSAPGDKTPALVYVDAEGNEQYKEGDGGKARQVGAIGVSPDGKYLAAMSAPGELTVYKINRADDGVVSLEETYVVPGISGNNMYDLAWDAAGNLYACNASTEFVRGYAIPRTEPATTAAAKAQCFMVTDGTVTGVDNVGVEAGPATYYNLHGIQVDGENLTPGVYVKVQGNSTSKVLVR